MLPDHLQARQGLPDPAAIAAALPPVLHVPPAPRDPEPPSLSREEIRRIVIDLIG